MHLPAIKRSALFELVLTVAIAVGLALALQAWAVKPYEIPSKSMEPTLSVGQRVLVNRLGTHFGDPEIGDIIVFHPPVGAEQQRCGVERPAREVCPEPVPQESEINFIKRVVAGPGDRLSIEDGHPIVNGVEAHEDYAQPCTDSSSCDFPKQITIPPGYYFVMGDNRPNSDDSRYWGPIPDDWVIGEAVLTYWPPNRIGLF
ncbi:MAG: signal peptidase I [Solirubrobacterales bacterium]|nr:signal peptidase I [Solirubrobacterales bacterium]